MPEPQGANMSEKLYLDDLYVGQKFISEGYPLDEAQIIAYAKQFGPQILPRRSCQAHLFSRSGCLVAGIRLPSACCW